MTRIEAFLAEQERIIFEDKQKTLISLGLTKKEYSPDNSQTWEYDKYEYNNGEKRYYKEVAIDVSDEEYSLILEKTSKVKSIREKEAAQRQAERSRYTSQLTKKWVPVFQKTIDEYALSNKEDVHEAGRSRTAKIIRIAMWIQFAVSVLGAIVVSVLTESIVAIPIVAFSFITEAILVEALAGILEYQAEQLEILRNGFKYNETSK